MLSGQPLSRRGVLGLAGLAALAGCSPATDDDGGLRIMVPNAPGGGYDTTARVVAQVLEEEDLARPVDVFNLEGAGGVVGLARTAGETGNSDLLLMMGLGMVGALYTVPDAAVALSDVTPIARLISEPEIIAVPADSRFDAMTDLVEVWQADPRRVRVGGGSQLGGPDHLAAHLLAQSVGIEPRRVEYQRYDGGGPLLAGLFNGTVDFAVSGLGEYADHIRTGEVRVLAVTGVAELLGLEAPTLGELGIPLDFRNWRGLVAPPGLSGEGRRSLLDLVDRMHGTAGWEEAERANGWTDDFLVGDPFGRFLAEETDRVVRLLDELGLPQPGATAS